MCGQNFCLNQKIQQYERQSQLLTLWMTLKGQKKIAPLTKQNMMGLLRDGLLRIADIFFERSEPV